LAAFLPQRPEYSQHAKTNMCLISFFID